VVPRDPLATARPAPVRLGAAPDAEPAVVAPPWHASDALQVASAAAAAAWQPATVAPVAGTPGPGNNAGSSSGAGRYARIRGAGTSAAGAVYGWSSQCGGDYAGDVPREVFAPDGAAREALRKSLGHLFLILVPAGRETTLPVYSHCAPKPFLPRKQGQARDDHHGPSATKRGKETRKETVQMFLAWGRKQMREGNTLSKGGRR
jgi:hypothetical protein